LRKYIANAGKAADKGELINAHLLAGSACFHQALFQDALAFFGQAEKLAARMRTSGSSYTSTSARPSSAKERPNIPGPSTI